MAENAELELLALARLGLADRLVDADVAREAQREGLAALERRGLLKRHQLRAVRAYVTGHARACACGRQLLLPEDGAGAPCPGCGAVVAASGGAAARPPGTIGPGTKVGPLEVLDKLGAGASGTVFKARHTVVGRLSALKVLGNAAVDPRKRRRFEREVEAMARLDHPGIVRVHAAYEHEGSLAFEMELVEGESLEARLERAGALPWREAVGMAVALARAIDHAHAQGVLHRDLKPGNVLLRADDGRALVADLGLGRLTDQSSSLTVAGALVGTPCYMPPEAFSGQSTPQGDVYGLGAVLYQALTGRPPFTADTLPALLHLVCKVDAPPMAVPGAPPELELVRARAMAKDPLDRYPTAAALADDLEAALAGRALSRDTTHAARARLARRAPRAAALLLLGLALVAVALTGALLAPSPPATGTEGPPADPPPVTVQEALLALERAAPTRGQALSLLLRATRDGDERDVDAREALDAAIARSPGAPLLRLGRALVLRADGDALVAADLAAVASVARALDPTQTEALATHAVHAGLVGADALEAARGLAAALPDSRAAATLHGLEALLRRDPALRAEAAAALARGLPGDVRTQRLSRALALTDRVVAALGRGPALREDARHLASELEALAKDPRAAPAMHAVLAPLGDAVRAALRVETLGDYVEGEPRRSLVRVLDAALEHGPARFVTSMEVLRDTDPDVSRDEVTREWEVAAERHARAVLEEDPVMGSYVLGTVANRRLWRSRSDAASEAAPVTSLHAEARAAAQAARDRGGLSETEDLWSLRTIHRSWADLTELDQRLAERTPSGDERRALLERALERAQRALAVSRTAPLLGRHLRMDAEDVVRTALELGRLDAAGEVAQHLVQPEVLRAELQRRRGDPAGALAVAEASLRSPSEPGNQAFPVAVAAMALVDLGRFDEARALVRRLLDCERRGDAPFLAALSGQNVASYLAAREGR